MIWVQILLGCILGALLTINYNIYCLRKGVEEE